MVLLWKNNFILKRIPGKYKENGFDFDKST